MVQVPFQRGAGLELRREIAPPGLHRHLSRRPRASLGEPVIRLVLRELVHLVQHAIAAARCAVEVTVSRVEIGLHAVVAQAAVVGDVRIGIERAIRPAHEFKIVRGDACDFPRGSARISQKLVAARRADPAANRSVEGWRSPS